MLPATSLILATLLAFALAGFASWRMVRSRTPRQIYGWFFVALFGAAIVAASPSIAADNFVVKDGNGASKTKAAKDIGSGVLADRQVVIDPSGADVDPATKANQAAANALLTALVAAATDATTASPISAAQLPTALGPKSNANSLATVNPKAASATLANVSVSTSSTSTLAANAARVGCSITSESSALVYGKFGSGASSTSYTFQMAGAASAPHAQFTCPTGYTGDIYTIGVSATGTLRVTEW